MKTCNICAQEKPLSEFVARGKSVRGYCKDCHKARSHSAEKRPMKLHNDDPFGLPKIPQQDADTDLFAATLRSLHEADAPFYDGEEDAQDAAPALAEPPNRVTKNLPPGAFSKPDEYDEDALPRALEQKAAARLEAIEVRIRSRLGDIIEDLREVQRDKLYRAIGYTRFEVYVKERWQGLGLEMSQGRLSQLMTAAKTRETLKNITNGNKSLADLVDKMPERQLRELSTVPDEQLSVVLETVTQIVDAKPAPVGKAALFHPKARATAADVKAAKASVLGTPTPPSAKSRVDAFFGDNETTGEEVRAEADADEPQEIVYEPHEKVRNVRWEADCHRLRFQVVTNIQIFSLWITERQLIEAGLPTMPEEAGGEGE